MGLRDLGAHIPGSLKRTCIQGALRGVSYNHCSNPTGAYIMGHEYTLVSNFDSVEQRMLWDSIVDRLGLPYNAKTPWHSIDGGDHCRQLLNTHPAIAEQFTGIIRTAYLYCNKIVITPAQLFDGVFFLALGPDFISEILARSHRDGPAIFVSGAEKDLTTCLESFYLTTIDNIVEKNDLGKDVVSDPHELAYRTIDSKRFSALAQEIEAKDAIAYGIQRRDDLAQELDQVHRGQKPIAEVIRQALEQIGSSDNQTFSFDLISSRWNEWIEAEREGKITYIQQRGGSFTSVDIAEQARKYRYLIDDLIEKRNASKPLCPAERLCIEALDGLSTCAYRSVALHIIQDLRDKIAKSDCPSDKTATITPDILWEWYQVVYNNTMATHIGANLISVTERKDGLVSSSKQTGGDTPILMLSGTIPELLGEMPSPIFSRLRYEHRKLLSSWRDCDLSTPMKRRTAITKGVAYAIYQISEQGGLAEDRSSLLARCGATLILAVAATLVDMSPSMESMPTGILFLIVLALQIAPDVIELAQWEMSTDSTCKTVVYLN